MLLVMEVGLGPDDIVLNGDPAPPPRKGSRAPPQFSAHVDCGQTAGWIKMALGTEVGLAPGHIVLGGNPAPLPKKGAEPPPIFGPFLLWPNGWMHEDATWYGGRHRPGDIVLDGDPAALPKKGAEPPPIFGPFILAKRLDASRCDLAWS